MNEARIKFKLHWVCPECGVQNGMRGKPTVMGVKL